MSANLTVLNLEEIGAVSGGVKWDTVGEGFLGLGATILAVAAAPETAGASLLLLGGAAGGFGSGLIIGAGLVSN